MLLGERKRIYALGDLDPTSTSVFAGRAVVDHRAAEKRHVAVGENRAVGINPTAAGLVPRGAVTVDDRVDEHKAVVYEDSATAGGFTLGAVFTDSVNLT